MCRPPDLLQCTEDLRRVYEAEAYLLRLLQRAKNPAELLVIQLKLQRINMMINHIQAVAAQHFMDQNEECPSR
ncbi:hypothetical protein Q1695_002515 [Nippostrongylus brasiliensis]|nr:hypothetical protein Q1695_002515 [Nippostrongylus brasiliensis]